MVIVYVKQKLFREQHRLNYHWRGFGGKKYKHYKHFYDDKYLYGDEYCGDMKI